MAGASSSGFDETLGSEELSVYNADSEVGRRRFMMMKFFYIL